MSSIIAYVYVCVREREGERGGGEGERGEGERERYQGFIWFVKEAFTEYLLYLHKYASI